MSERELSILIISYYFPPNAEVGSRRVARFCQYLPHFGIRPIVLTIDQASCEALDLSLQGSQQLQMERVRPRATILDWYRRRAEKKITRQPACPGARRVESEAAKRSFSIRRHVLALLQFPDMNRGWYRPAVRMAARLVSTLHVDAVLSSGPPWTAHAVGHTVSRRCGLPWIADFRDLWASDPWRKYAYNSKGLPAWRDRLDWWIEDRWVNHAALIVCTTNRQGEALVRAHPRLDSHRVVTIPNGFDGQQSYPDLGSAAGDGRRVLLHAGDLYGGRRIDVFCQAISSLVRLGRLSADTTKINLMGEVDTDIEREARDASPELFKNGMISFVPRVDWERSQQRLRDADVLLIFQGDHPTAIPAKFFEYLQTGKPILALVSDGALRDIVLRTGSGFVADPNDQMGIASAIEQVLQAKPRTAKEVQRVAGQFDFRHLTAELAANIRDALR